MAVTRSEDNPLRVLMVAACPFPAPRGTPTRILRLAEGVAAFGHDVHVLAYHLGSDVEPRGITVHRSDEVPGYQRFESGPTYGKLWIDFKLFSAMKRLLEERRFDVIHAHHYEGLLTALLAERRKSMPIIYDAHTLASAELPDYGLFLPRVVKRWIGRQLDTRLPPRATCCITASEKLETALVEMGAVASNQVTTIANGVECKHFSLARSPSTRPPWRLVFTGSLAPYQGIDILLEMFQGLCRKREDVELQILTNDRIEGLGAEVRRRGLGNRVMFGASDFSTLPQHLARADVALNPRPVCDGVPQKLLNYMAAGCPIVSFRGSARHLRHEQSALLVDEPSSDKLAQAVSRLLDNPELAARLGEAARAVAQSKLSWELASADTIAVYMSLSSE